MEPRHRLGQQLMYRNGRTRLPKAKVQTLLDEIWEKATAWISTKEAPATRKELLLRARPALTRARAKLEGPDAALSAADRVVLSYACDEIERLSLEKITLPWRQIKHDTGLGETTVKYSLARLVDKRHLLVATPGGSGKADSRKATAYQLPASKPVNGSMGPPRQGQWDPPSGHHWDPFLSTKHHGRTVVRSAPSAGHDIFCPPQHRLT